MYQAIAPQSEAASGIEHAELDVLLAHALDVANRMDARAGLELAERALTLARERHDVARTARALGIVASASRTLADYPRAATAALESLDLLEQSDVRAGRAYARVQVALVFFELADYPRALFYLDDARRDLGEDADPAVEACCVHAEGMVQSRLADFPLARRAFERALVLRRAIGDGGGLATTLNSLGVLHLRLAQAPAPGAETRTREFEQALANFREAGDLARRTGDARLAMLVEINVASALAGLGRLDEALERFLIQLDAARASGDRANESLVLANAGEAARLKGDHERARSLCDAALAVAQAAASKVREQQARLQLSLACEACGDFKGALVQYKAHHTLERETQAAEARRTTQALSLRTEIERARREAVRLRRTSLDLERQNRMLGRQAREDPLTGLANRRAFDDALDARRREAHSGGRPLAIVLVDVDRFKAINDRFSHATGDAVLCEVATMLRTHCRASDLAARIGGDEFALLLPGADRDSAIAVAERLRADFAARDWTILESGLAVSISAGVAADTGAGNGNGIVREADAALYRAKRGGRNRVCAA